MKKTVLRRLIAGGFLILAFSFAFILISSLSERRTLDSTEALSSIAVGETGKRRFRDQRVWATRTSRAQRDRFAVNHPCRDDEFCVVSASGIKAEIDLVYTPKAPPQLDDSSQWWGGFVDPSNGYVYDLGGTAILPANAKSLLLIQP